MKFFFKSFKVLLIVAFMQQVGISQTCPPTSSITAGSNTTICSGNCASLTASVSALNTSSTYSVGATAFTPQPFFGGAPAIGNIDDVWGAAINIGFNFCYFGNTFNQLVIGSNGEITFNLAAANGSEFFTVNTVLPNLVEHQPNTICGAYRDIDPSIGFGSTVTYYSVGVAPCRRFVANWTNVPLYSCNNPTSTFQIVLYERSNIIDIYIQNSTACLAWQNGKGLVGIQDGTGTTAVTPPGRNILTPWTAINEAWRFTPTGAPTYTVNWAGPAGFTATGLTAAPCPTATSNYTATMTESNCGGTTSTFSSAVQVSVTPTATLVAVANPTSICSGSSATLTASGAASYTWNPGAITGASVSVSPTVTTVYTVTGTNGSCTSTSTLNLLVQPSPTITAVVTATAICPGSSATLAAFGAITYTWNPGALAGPVAVVSPSATTIYTVTGTNISGCSSTQTVTLVVSPLSLTTTASPTVICNGGSSTLTASGATSYTWNPGGTTSATVVVTPTATIVYTVTGVTGSCSNTQTITLTVSTSPTITSSSSPTLLCLGSTATLTASGASTYTWNPGALTGATIAITPTATTIYTVDGTNAAGCIGTGTISINTKALPNITAAASPTIICGGSSSTLTALGAVSYTWTPGALSGSTVNVTPSSTTIFTVTGANGSGCTNTKTVSVTVSNLTVNATSNPTVLCAGFTATLTASGASTYTWNPGAVSGTTIAVTPTATTVYTVVGTTTLGCTAATTLNLTVNPNPTVTAVSNPTA
ncbi:MAG: hypothetical protein H7141_08410, partial [Burkholderiales bacterium]|nr:hypothetical protein [Bacteroidia bacterium]